MDKPVFENKCQLCLGCIYGCPCKALKPGISKFVVVKDGYSLKELEKRLPYEGQINVEELATGYLWIGVRKYLLE